MILRIGIVAFSIAACIARVPAAEIVAVCPLGFQEALRPWIEHRREQGLETALVDSHADVRTLQSVIRDSADDDTRYVLLVGDVPGIGNRCDCATQIPIGYVPTTVSNAWGSTPTLSTDLLFGDLDNDRVPDAAVGRLPVRTREQLERMVKRIIAYEQSRDFGPWRNRVQVVGGVGGFGPLIDGAIESVTRSIITGVLPKEVRASITYASPGHRFYPDKPFTDAVVANYQRGARFWVYAGHGRITELDRVPPTPDGVPVLDRSSVHRLSHPDGGAPIALVLACYAGALDAPDDCIAKQMLLCDGGPIAVLAGSRVTMPYGNTTAAVGLIEAVYKQNLPRLGDAWQSALFDMYREANDEEQAKSIPRMMIDGLASVISPPGTPLAAERREHMLLYNLIGDPTLQLNHPQPVSITVAPGHEPGTPINVTLRSPIAGDATISLDRPLGAETGGDPNEVTIVENRIRVEQNRDASTAMTLPDGFQGPLIVRVQVSGQSGWAASAARTMVRAEPLTTTVDARRSLTVDNAPRSRPVRSVGHVRADR